MKAEEFKNMIREIIREELQNLTTEEKYDSDKDLRAMGFRSWDDYYRTYPQMDPNAPKRKLSPEEERERDEWRKEFKKKLDAISAKYAQSSTGTTTQPTGTTAPTTSTTQQTKAPARSSSTDRTAMLSQMVKYKNVDGSEGEASVKSLLGYPKDHPGRKAAARIYAQFMAKNRKQESICEGEGCLDEKSVPPPYDRKGARKMAKSQIALRKKIGDAMMRDEKKKSYFRKKHGDDWKSYLWAAASSSAFRQSGSTKSDDKKKK